MGAEVQKRMDNEGPVKSTHEEWVKGEESLIFKGDALIDILRITVRQELGQEYSLDLGEMYLLMDYVSVLKGRIENQKQSLRAMREMARRM